MKNLQHILYRVRLEAIHGNTDLQITSITSDSRKVISGGLFIALKGLLADGHLYIQSAIDQGAHAIICESIPPILKQGVTYIQVADGISACAAIASNFFDNPSAKINLIGVTGTNGKTTIVTLLFQLFSELGYTCGLISTVKNQIGDEIIVATHTTPDIITLNELLAGMIAQNCEYAFMEVSSHAIHQHRIAGLNFRGGIFSNITHDHLDYHGSFDEYIRVKKSFFDLLPSNAFALSNVDDKRGQIMLQNTQAAKYTYSLKAKADYKGKILENNLTGLIMQIMDQEVHFRLIGEFNAYNLIAVFSAAVLCGQNSRDVLRVLSNQKGAEGRFDYVVSTREKIIGIIDYAHTPDALLNVLSTINKLRQGHEKLITVVGCGGDRDRSKRPIMARIAAEQSDWLLITSDNPRSEDPMAIIHEMETGIPPSLRKKKLTVADRREAINLACSMAAKEDIILIAGKGHEKYQEIMGKKYEFDDKRVLRESLELMNK